MGKHSIKNTAGSFQKKGEGHAESEGIAELIEIQMEKAEDKALKSAAVRIPFSR